MSSTGTGYDLEASTFSPDGRIFQIEYAAKCVENSGTALGLRGKDGVLIAVEKSLPSKLVMAESNPRVFRLAENAVAGVTGLYPDGKTLVRFCVEQANDYVLQKSELMPGHRLVQRLSEYMHNYTLYSVRPFGASVFLGFWNEEDGPQLFMVDPSASWYPYKAWATGKGRQAAKAEIEKLKFEQLTCAQLVTEAARILHSIRDAAKDKNVVLEMIWIGRHTDGKSALVPADVLAQAEKTARDQLDQAEDVDMGH